MDIHNKIQKDLEDCAKELNLKPDRGHPATLLQDDQPLASGLAIVQIDHGRFYPASHDHMNFAPSDVTHLKIDHSETLIAVQGFRQCDSYSSSLHYHFKVKKSNNTV